MRNDLLQYLIPGNVCAIVSAFLNPIDVTKIRMQNQSSTPRYHGLVSGALLIYSEEGMRGWCKGITSSMLRELLYSSIRIGSYEPIRAFLSKAMSDDGRSKGNQSCAIVKYTSALISGGVGSAIANPLDLIKIRFQSILPGDIPPYKSNYIALKSIYYKEGLYNGLYKGWVVTSSRAAVLTSAQVGSYDSIKNNLLINVFHMEEGFKLHFISSMLAGIITCTVTNPIDVVKSRYMSDLEGKYKSPIQVINSTFRNDGLIGFMKGWTPSYMRLGPHTVISFLLIEKIRLFFGLSAF